MRRVGWTIFAGVLACAVAEGPESESEPQGRRLSEFDAEAFAIIDVDDLPDGMIRLDVDGDAVELAEAVDAETVVLARDLAAEVTEPEQSVEPDELPLTADSDPQAACPFRVTDEYIVPKYEQVWTCVPGGWGQICYQHWAWVDHFITCHSNCISCVATQCWDGTSGTSTSKPSSTYLVSHETEPCN
jgi:hypothetical protein